MNLKKILPVGTVALAGLVGAGVMAFPASTAAPGSDDPAITKREDGATEVADVDDNDDDDTNADTKSRKAGADNSRDVSRASAVSRDAQVKQPKANDVGRDVSRASTVSRNPAPQPQPQAQPNDVSRDVSRDAVSRDVSRDQSVSRD